MPHVLRRPGILAGTGLAVFLALVHTVNDAITAILGALLPSLQARFGAGLGSLLGGALAPRLGRRLVLTGSLLAIAAPLIWLLHLDPGSLPFFLAAALGGTLIYTSSPVMVVAAQDLAPHARAAASGWCSVSPPASRAPSTSRSAGSRRPSGWRPG